MIAFAPPSSRLHPCMTLLLSVALIGSGLGLAPAPATAETGSELQLENGLRILLRPHPGSGLVASNVFVGAGSTREEERYAGSSHFLEHLLFNGTIDRTQEEIYEAADRIGGHNNATTRQEYTHYMMIAPSEHLEAVFDLQSDMLLRSTLPPDKFEKERGIVIEEISQDRDDPEYRRDRVEARLLHGADSDFERPVLGTPETISALPRDAVMEYYRRQYVPSNMKLLLMGDFDPDAAVALIQRHFRQETLKGEAVAPVAAPALELPPGGVLLSEPIDVPEVELTATLALHIDSARDAAALALLSDMLGAGEGHRLQRTLNLEPALDAERASGSLQHREGATVLRLEASFGDPAQLWPIAQRMVAALDAPRHAISSAELEQARTRLLSQEISQLEQMHYYAIFQGDRIWHMQEGFIESFLAALAELDADALSAIARRLIEPSGLRFCATGPGLEAGRVEFPQDLLAGAAHFHLDSASIGPSAMPKRHRPTGLTTPEAPAVIRFENGLRMVHAASPTTRMVALHLMITERAAREPAELRGIADVLHRCLPDRVLPGDDGAPPRHEAIGAELKVTDNPWIPYDDYYSTPQYSFVRLGCVDEYYRNAIDYLASMVRAPHLDEAHLSEARGEIQMVLQRNQGSARAAADRALDALLFAGHPLGLPYLSDDESLARITPERLRAFAAEYLAPDHLVLGLVGNVPRAEAVDQVAKAFGTRPLEDDAAATGAAPALPAVTHAPQRELLEIGGNQSALRMGRTVELADGDEWALHVAVSIASNRMQQELRETRGLAYSLGMGVSVSGNRATIIASMGTRPENLEEAEAGMREFIAIGTLEATDEEIETAVNRHLGRMRMRKVTSMGQAFNLCRDHEYRGGIDFGQREADGLRAVTPEDVARAAGRYLGAAPLVIAIAR